MRRIGAVALSLALGVASGVFGQELSLEEARAAARKNNGEIRMAKAEAESKIGDVMKEKSERWFRMQGGYTHQDEPKTGENHRIYNNRVQFTVDQPLYTFGHITGQIRKAEYKMKAAQDEASITELDVLYDVTRAYYDLVLKEETVAIREANLKSSQKSLQEAQALRKEGRATELDVKRAEVAVAADENDLAAAKEALTIARQRLNFLMGKPDLDAPVQATDRLVYQPLPSDGLAATSEAALMSNPRLRQNTNYRLAAEHGRKAAFGGHFPMIYLEFIWAYNDKQNQKKEKGPAGQEAPAAGSFAGEYNSWYISLMAQWPFMKNAIEAHGRYKEALALLRKTQYAREHITNGLRLQVREALAELAEAERNVDVAQKQLAAAELNLKNVKALVSEGVAKPGALAEAERTLANAKLDQLKAIAQHKMAIAKLERATSQPIEALVAAAGGASQPSAPAAK